MTMATTSIPHRWKYDVFVSFRGEDIRKSFMDHLFNDFKQKGIHAFRDDRELPKGEEIYPHLYKAIEESRFLIVIFSKNYASSTWCLRELVKILERKQIENPKHEVRIIFYDAKPDVVRKQKRSYAQAFYKHEVSNSPDVGKWKEALSMAANLSGWDLEDMTNGYESKFIDCISKEIIIKLCDGPLHVGENLVGIDSHFDKLNLPRFVRSDKVNMIGICGISGIGKTTLAKAIYNLMYIHFDGSCFCEDIQGVQKRQGLTQVQMQIVEKILKIEDAKISSVGEGAMVIKQRMACKPILLVLDDVNNVEQLEALAGSRDWFYPGSLIIFTGKDKQLLRSHKVDGIYDVETLDYCKALELFSLYAFGKRHPTEDFEEFASQIVKYLHGHPLALKVFGRLLYEKSLYVWKSELDRLQTYPNSEIVQKLRPSFDNLASDQKRMFLDVACAFIGENKDFAASVLDSSNCSANAIFEVLVDKFLITVSASNMSIQIHELIQSMAREILREESSMPGNQNRLWISSEDYDVLNVNKVTEEVEVLVLFLKENYQNIPTFGNAFTRMKNLRILKICFPDDVRGKWQPFAVNFSGRLDFLSNKLRLLYWHGMPLQFLPSDFYPINIVAIDFSYSHIKHLWTTPKCFKRLKIMKLRHCCNLTTTPDFSEITNLEELSLEGCLNLVSVHPSIGMLKRLVVLNLRDCKRLQNFPSRVEMDALQVLNLSGCLNVNQLPQAFWSRWWTSIPGFIWNQHPQRSVSLEGLHMLTSLNLSYCNLVQVPESIGGLSFLKELKLQGNNLLEVPESIGGLSCLEDLDLDGNNLVQVPDAIGGLSFLKKLNLQRNNLLEVPESIGGLSCLEDLDLDWNNLVQVPDAIGGLSCLERLYLKGNNFTSLPGSLSQLSHLEKLRLDGCKKLEVLPKLPPNLYHIGASDCTSLREVSGSSKDPFMYSLNNFDNCPKLGSLSNTQCLDSSITSQGFIHQLSAFLGYLGFKTNRSEFFLQHSAFDNLQIVYHGNSIPEWFTNRSKENHVKVELPSDWCFNKFKGFGICVVLKKKKHCQFPRFFVKNFDGASLTSTLNNLDDIFKDFLRKEVIGIHESSMIWLLYVNRNEALEMKEAKNFVTFCFEENNEDVEAKEFGIRLIFDGDLQQDITNLGMFQDLSQHGGAMILGGPTGYNSWSW